MVTFKTESTENTHHHEIFRGEDHKGKLTLIFPTWAGITNFERRAANKLNTWGHNAIIVDFFGQQTDLSTTEHRKRAMTPFVEDLSRLNSHLSTLIQPISKKFATSSGGIGAIGFCLGGLCAIHSGLNQANIGFAVSFHGLLKLPESGPYQHGDNRFLILNGSRDPMVSTDDVSKAIAFFDNHNLDMTFVSLSGTYHSFMLPNADQHSAGIVYNEKSANQCWRLCRDFIE